MAEITITKETTIGKGAAQRTTHHLSNGWFIVDNGPRGQREHRFAIYKRGPGGKDSFIHGDSKLKKLLEYVNTHHSGS